MAGLYNAATDKWTPVAPSALSRPGPSAVNVNGRIFVLGAIQQEGAESVEEFLPATNTW